MPEIVRWSGSTTDSKATIIRRHKGWHFRWLPEEDAAWRENQHYPKLLSHIIVLASTAVPEAVSQQENCSPQIYKHVVNSNYGDCRDERFEGEHICGIHYTVGFAHANHWSQYRPAYAGELQRLAWKPAPVEQAQPGSRFPTRWWR